MRGKCEKQPISKLNVLERFDKGENFAKIKPGNLV